MVAKFLKDKRGTASLEYAIIAVVFTIGCMTAWQGVAGGNLGYFERIAGVFAGL